MHPTIRPSRLRATFLRHADDEQGTDPAPPADHPPADPPPKDDTSDVEKWKALARKHEQRAKENADAARRLAEIEDAAKSDLERERERAARAEQQAAAALERARQLAVRSAVVAAATDAVDPDAVLALIDTAALDIDDDLNVRGAEAAVAALLESKPYLRRSEQRPTPGFPTQGAGTSAPPKDMTDRKTLAAELAKYGLRPRS